MKKPLIILIVIFLVGVVSYAFTQAAFVPNSQQVSVSSGLVDHWTLNGADSSGNNVFDRGSNSKTGVLTSGASKVSGKIGQAVSCDGTNDYVTFGSGKVDSSTSGTWTGWIYLRAFEDADSIIGYGGADGAGRDGQWGVQTRTVSSVQRIGVVQEDAGGATLDGVSTTSAVPIGKWFHFAVTGNGSTWQVFLNGNKESPVTTFGSNTGKWIGGTTTYGTDFTYLCATRWSGVDSGFSNAILDDVRMYSRVLSDNEIYQIYRQTGGNYISSSQNVASQSSTSGLVGHFTMNGSDMTATKVLNVGSAGGSGTLTGGTRRAPGKMGQGLFFDGTDDYVDAGNILNQTTNDFTITAWVKPVDRGSTMPIVNKRDENSVTNDGYAVSLLTSTGKTFSLMSDGSASRITLTGTNGVPFGKWSLVAVTYDRDGNMTHYINGVQNGSVSISAQPGDMTNTRSFLLGTNDNLGSHTAWYKDTMDDVRIYNRVLTENEIYNIYKYGGTANINTQAVANQGTGTGLVSHWTFNGADTVIGATNFFKDMIGSNNATTTGAYYTAGKIGQGWRFDGTNTVFANDSASLDLTTTGTISLWAKSAGDQENLAGLFSKNSGGTAATVNYSLQWTGSGGTGANIANNFRFLISNGTSVQNLYYAFNPSTNTKWNHIVAQWNSTTMNMYVNGQLATTTANTLAAQNLGSRFKIGGLTYEAAGGGGSEFTGVIDDVRVFNTFLSPNEVYNLYMYGK